MLIYLDTMLVQYCVDYEDFVFGEITGYKGACPVLEPELADELSALRQLIFLDQLGDWVYACTPSLLHELYARKPSGEQSKIYQVLSEAWQDSGWEEAFPLNLDKVSRVEASLKAIKFHHNDDRQHLAEAIVLGASWFLTNDKEVINKCNRVKLPLHIARPSQYLEEISVGLFLK